MALIRWDPWRDMLAMQRDVQETLHRFLGEWETPSLIGSGSRRSAWFPPVDVFTRESDLVVRTELPGMDPEKDVEIFLQDGSLTIRGERRHEERTDGEGYVRSESAYGSFERRVPLPEGIEEKDVHATYERGVLEVVIAGAARIPEPTRIPIEAGGSRKALTSKGRKR
jgi:HSP20 family protein